MSQDREGLLERLDRYLDQAPRLVTSAEEIGPFNLFRAVGPWRYYARPAPGSAARITAGDVEAVVARQRQLGQPEKFEWLADTAPDVATAAREAGLRVELKPLLVLEGAPSSVDHPNATARVLSADDPAIPAAMAAVHVGFKVGGTSIGPEGIVERDLAIGELGEQISFTRERVAAGHQVIIAAEVDGEPVAAGSTIPHDGVAELAGIATLPAWRGRGLAGLLTAALANAARARGADVLLLGADSEGSARVYERVGFVRVATIGEASRAL